MREFAYHRPQSVAEAVGLLSQSDEIRPLAGGMTLLPTMKLRLAAPDALIDLTGIAELRGITPGEGEITVGAMTRHAELGSSEAVRAAIPALAALASEIGDPQVRNRGTLGGSLANNDPTADYPSAAVALGATIVTDRREIAAGDFFLGLFETALAPGEIITAVRFPVVETAGYAKLRNPASRFPVVGVFVARHADGVRVAVIGAASCVFRSALMEEALNASFTPAAVERIVTDAALLNGDMHADAEYRAHLVTVMAKRAVEAALSGRGMA